jgi:hypothetical protein
MIFQFLQVLATKDINSLSLQEVQKYLIPGKGNTLKYFDMLHHASQKILYQIELYFSKYKLL